RARSRHVHRRIVNACRCDHSAFRRLAKLCDFGPDGLSSGASPDRLDALVWAVTHLLLDGAREPRIRRL
ncbi:hypothetical protein, partial [Methylobacterium brachiatum]|uniref:hypothetical protein n=1 Tax=Methylobacterium brachiatum TaxID=269660 RepID=UPI001FCDF3AE